MLKDLSVKIPQARPARTRPAQAQPAQTKPAQARATQVKSAEVKSADVKSADVKSAEAKPAQARSAEAKGGAAKAADRTTRAAGARVVATGAVHNPARAMDELERLIQQRAYELWESEGRPQGRDQDHWQLAEREITGRTATGRA